MGEIIELQRHATPVRARSRQEPPAPVLVDPWLVPVAVMRAGIAFWASCWLAPLGLKVELAERDPVEIGPGR